MSSLKNWFDPPPESKVIWHLTQAFNKCKKDSGQYPKEMVLSYHNYKRYINELAANYYLFTSSDESKLDCKKPVKFKIADVKWNDDVDHDTIRMSV